MFALAAAPVAIQAVNETEKRDERISVRVSKITKELLEHASAIQGRSLTDYVVSTAREAAMKEVQEHHRLVLSNAERRAFFEVLTNPPEPSKKAFEELAQAKALFGTL